MIHALLYVYILCLVDGLYCAYYFAFHVYDENNK